MAELPLLRRFPALATLPRAALGVFPTPVERILLSDGRALWIKRDDRTGLQIGGNKVRALEWLLGAVRPGDGVLTVGPRGSTHALATAVYAKLLGARPTVVGWPQEMNPAAIRVAARLRAQARVIDAANVPAAYAIAWWRRARSRDHWIPAGGTTPIGVLGHVNAVLELAQQIDRGECPAPTQVVVPLGTGGTAAGIALGLRIAGIHAGVSAVRVAPRIAGSGVRIMWLAHRTAALIERLTRERLPRVERADLLVDSDFYAGGYGRAIGRSLPEEAALSGTDILLDDTYSRKAFAAAVEGPGDTTLFWLTFDGRLLQD